MGKISPHHPVTLSSRQFLQALTKRENQFILIENIFILLLTPHE